MSKYLPAKITKEHQNKLETVATDFRQICTQDDNSPITAIQRSMAMQQLRELLTPEIIQPVLSLQGNPLGFKTDKDFERGRDKDGNRIKGSGYGADVVRDVFIYALGKGARMIGNEVNILAGNPYLTKEYFLRRLNEVLGAENWKITHAIPHIVNSGGKTGAIVKSKVWWRDSATGNKGSEHEIEFAIKGDEYASADAYCGKADRKAGKWLLENCTGERFSDGDASEAIEVTAVEVEDTKPAESTAEKAFNQQSGDMFDVDPE